MDIVGGFNHLIPSDQLEDSLLLGQNLECEAGEEAGPGGGGGGGGAPEDSFKNMLSDQDPMFGLACSQFLLEHDDPGFQRAAGSPASERDAGGAGLQRGRRRQTAFRGRRGGRGRGPSRNLSLNPVVVLRRLTVTVGGFRIELLPGPCPAPPSAAATSAPPPSAQEGGALEFGPCVNPNDVQHTNGAGDGPKGPPEGGAKPATPGVKPPRPPKPPRERARGPKPEPTPAPVPPPHPPKRPQERGEGEDRERLRSKRPERLPQRQRSRASLEEPELFVPDNAPMPRKDPEPSHDVAWDSNKRCGLCDRPHGNRFMVGCSRCDDWLHGDCVGLDLAKVRQMESHDQEYVCLKCCAHHDGGAGHAPGRSRDARVDAPRVPRKDPAERVPPVELSKIAPKTPPTGSKRPSTGQIRRSVRDSLEEILLKRLKGSDLKVPEERPAEVARATEKELFALFSGVDGKYKSKYRSLTFNLRDAKNNVLFKRVLRGGVSPRTLVRMSAEELASKELAAWRQRENRHAIEMIEKEQREGERRRPVTKITHKGEIEIEDPEAAKMLPEVPADDPAPSLAEVPEAPQLPGPGPTSPEKIKDTTGLHKSHLFDLHCKICTGRMAPPVEEPPTKVVKVATSVTKRRHTAPGGGAAPPTAPGGDEAPPTATGSPPHLPPRAAEGGLLDFPAYESRLEGREDTAAFLASLEASWCGLVDMPAVARLHTRAFPVSGSPDLLAQDLPGTVQVGGRISPQNVWDYVEKIRASGTKEICVVRFSPETEEDEIPYALLYAYFSSRRRYGVVANNRRRVKDMYLVPLGSAERVPHHIVPFDGPGLETGRPNLLLGLIIRQRPSRDFGALLPGVTRDPPGGLPPPLPPPPDPLPRHTAMPLPPPDPAGDSAPAPEPDLERNVSLRFLPGVLTRPDGEAPRAAPLAPPPSAMPPHTAPPRLGAFVIRKKESGAAKAFSLSDKPGDVSTEAFLSGAGPGGGASGEEEARLVAPGAALAPPTPGAPGETRPALQGATALARLPVPEAARRASASEGATTPPATTGVTPAPNVPGATSPPPPEAPEVTPLTPPGSQATRCVRNAAAIGPSVNAGAPRPLLPIPKPYAAGLPSPAFPPYNHRYPPRPLVAPSRPQAPPPPPFGYPPPPHAVLFPPPHRNRHRSGHSREERHHGDHRHDPDRDRRRRDSH